MPIKTESLAKLLVRLKIVADEPAATALINGEAESDVVLPAGIQVFSDEELATRDNSSKATYTKAGSEISVKQLKDLTGLTYDGEGSKDPKRFIEEYAKKVLEDAKISVDDKISDRDKTIGKLRETIKTIESAQTESEKKAKVAQQDYDLLMATHDLKPDHLEDREWIGLLKMSNELVEEGGQLYVKRNGEIVKDQKLQTPVPAKDALRGFITERKIGKDVAAAAEAAAIAAAAAAAAGGRGVGDSKGNTGGITNMTGFNAHLEKNNINPKSPEAQALLTKTANANTNFDFNH